MNIETQEQETLTYEPPKTFDERARPLLDTGMPGIPLAANSKIATLKGWNTADFGWRNWIVIEVALLAEAAEEVL